MRELRDEEEQWLEVFAKYNPFFKDLLNYYLENNSLTKKQYEYLEKEIDKAEEEGNKILDKADFMFLKSHAEEFGELNKILETYEDDGFLDETDFNTFIDIKLELNPDFKKRDKSQKTSEKDSPKSDVAKKINLEKVGEFLNKEILSRNPNSNIITYVLRLENKKWWIGKTKLILKTIEDVKRGRGKKWIQENPVVAIEELLFQKDTASLTLDYMKKYGWENVQGSSWYENQVNMYIPVKILNYVNEQKKLKTNNNTEFNDFEIDEQEVTSDIEESTYVLKLEKEKWYIGRTSDLESELNKHKSGNKTSWTKLYELEKVEEKDLKESQRETTIKYMKKYGWWNVRGYTFRRKGEDWPPEEIADQYNFAIDNDLEDSVIYILRLENDKWFIGRTKNMERSLKFHKLGSPPWLDIHKYVEVEEIIENGDFVEVTLEYMRKYGWENVRGAHWRSWDMKAPPRVLRKKLEF